MANVKKILVIDDHFEMLEFLRSMLELANPDYEVLAVPSAEEGLLELRRTNFNLVITDVRLPGMSGFDLTRKVKTIRSSTPIIMITAYTTTEGRLEAEGSGVFRYFPKPIDTDEMMAAVHEAIYGAAESPTKATNTTKATAVSRKPLPAPASADPVRKRLDLLRTDTGAAKLVLATKAGQVTWKVGDGRIPNLEKLTTILSRNMENSFLLSQELGNQNPFTLQYHVGEPIELYVANVGVDHFLALFFDVKARRGRIGTVWVFAQRAIKDLLGLLPVNAPLIATEPAAKPITAGVIEAAVEITPEKTDAAVPDSTPPTEPISDPEPEETSDDWLDITPEELASLLDSDIELVGDTGALNNFWDEASAQAEGGNSSGGFSWEEAKRQGLIPADLDKNQDLATK